MDKFVWCFKVYDSNRKKIEILNKESRFWAILSTKEKAIKEAMNIFFYEEGYYCVGIIEKIRVDGFPHGREEYWFYYSSKRNKVRQIKKPNTYKQICGFTVG